MRTPNTTSDENLEDEVVETSRGIPSPRRAGEPDTGDTVTATSEGGTTAGPDFGSVWSPPGEGGLLSGPSEELEREERGQ